MTNKIQNIRVRLKSVILITVFILTFIVGACSKITVELKASVMVANSADKILQSYDGTSAGYSQLKEKFMGGLTESFNITAFKNEYESAQIIITPEQDVKSYNVEVSDFTNGNSRIESALFDVRHEYYHNVRTIYAQESEMLPGMYPDALLPLNVARSYGITNITAGNNQAVYITVKIPKTATAGVYSGTVKVTLENSVVKTVDAKITVLDYTLPDKVSLATCIPLQPYYLFSGELNDTQELYDKYADMLTDFRLSVMYLSSHLPGSSIDPEGINFASDLDVKYAIDAAKDERVSAYAIRVFEKYMQEQDGYVLNEEVFLKYLKKYVDGSIESGENLFKKAYVYMGNIIDEPDVGVEPGVTAKRARANFVCTQYEDVIAQAVAYADAQGASGGVINALRNMQHVVTGHYSHHLPEVTTYCPMINDFEDSVSIEDYNALRDIDKNYWWYTCTQPKTPFPTYHIDDNGVSSRVMSWMAKEYNVDGYLTWESVYYQQFISEAAGPEILRGIEVYDETHRFFDAYGDGVLFYPGKVFGIDGPVPSFRLATMRDGMEDYEALTDLENMYAALGQTYGANLSASGIMNELYAAMFSGVKVFCTSQEVENVKKLLGGLLELAVKGIAVSDFKIDINGTVTANIYAPNGADVKLNGTAVTFSNNLYSASVLNSMFKVESGGIAFELKTGTVSKKDGFAASSNKLTVYDAKQTADATASITNVVYDGVTTAQVVLKTQNTRMDLNIADYDITSKTDAMIIGIYSQNNEKIEMSVSVYGNNKSRLVDIVYLHPGYNELRFDRLKDLDWATLRKGSAIIFGFSKDKEIVVNLSSVTVIER